MKFEPIYDQRSEIYPLGISIMVRYFFGRYISLSVVSVITAAFRNEFYYAVILVINSVGIVFDIVRVPYKRLVVMVEMNNGFSRKTNALKGTAIIKIQAGFAVL